MMRGCFVFDCSTHKPTDYRSSDEENGRDSSCGRQRDKKGNEGTKGPGMRNQRNEWNDRLICGEVQKYRHVTRTTAQTENRRSTRNSPRNETASENGIEKTKEWKENSGVVRSWK